VIQASVPGTDSARNGLFTGLTKPYRYRGRPGWNPAAAAIAKHQADIAKPCPSCDAPAGQNCVTSGGRIYSDWESSHIERRRAA